MINDKNYEAQQQRHLVNERQHKLYGIQNV